MREIGGYFEMETSNGEIYHRNALALNSGRHCLEYLLMAKKIKKLYIPDFMCDTAVRVCEKHHCRYEYYPIRYDFLPDIRCKVGEEEYVYIVNDYGQLPNELLSQLAARYGNVIIDNVEAFFQMPLEGIDTIYSCRKFFGVSDGAYLYTTARVPGELETDVSYDRIRFVLGRYDKDASTFFQEASYNNAVFDSQPVRRMSKLTENILRNISYTEVKVKREKNFAFLHQYLKEINEIAVSLPVGAFMYPLCVKNGPQLRKKLIEKKIYVPCLWKDVFRRTEPGSAAWYFAENIVPLPCDQRYGENEMSYMANQVLNIIQR